jgi:hypothetical protein
MENETIHSQSSQPLFSMGGASQIAVMELPVLYEMAPDAEGGGHFVVIPVEDVDKLSMNAIRYAKLLNGEIVAVHILLNPFDLDQTEYRWKLQHTDIPLLILESHNGSLIEPLMAYVDGIRRRCRESFVTIVLPVLSGLKWWQRVLHNQMARLIEKAFEEKSGVVIIRVPFSLQDASYKGSCVR